MPLITPSSVETIFNQSPPPATKRGASKRRQEVKAKKFKMSSKWLDENGFSKDGAGWQYECLSNGGDENDIEALHAYCQDRKVVRLEKEAIAQTAKYELAMNKPKKQGRKRVSSIDKIPSIFKKMRKMKEKVEKEKTEKEPKKQMEEEKEKVVQEKDQEKEKEVEKKS